MTRAEQEAREIHYLALIEANRIAIEQWDKGYKQAEKDIITLIESRLSELFGDAQPTPILRYELQDLIKKIKEKE